METGRFHLFGKNNPTIKVCALMYVTGLNYVQILQCSVNHRVPGKHVHVLKLSPYTYNTAKRPAS